MSGFGYTDIVSGAGMDPRNQPCNPAEDGVCEALECCKNTDPDILRESHAAWKNLSKVYKAARQADEYLLRQALEALEVFGSDDRVDYEIWDKSCASEVIVAIKRRLT